MKFSFLCLLIIASITLLPLNSQAQVPPPDTVRGIVQDYLNQQLGYAPTLLAFTFEGRTWEDSSLGCPLQGQSYTPGQIAGYQWKFLMGDGIRYALHSDIYGTQVILCASASEAVLTYSTFNTTYFAINHPNIWSAQQLDPHTVNFTFQGQATCAFPEMRVLVLANLPDSASILDAYYTSLGLPIDRNKYVPLLDKGLTTLHTEDCGGVLRRVQATGITSTTNAAYLVLQAAPLTVFDIWSAPFVEMIGSFVAGTSPVSGSGATLGAVTVSQAPTPLPEITPTPVTTVEAVNSISVPTTLPSLTPTPPPTLPNPPAVPELDLTLVPLAHVFLGDVHVGALNNLPGLRLNRLPGQRQQLRLSRDGQQLAYIENGNSLNTVAIVAPVSPNPLAEDAFGDFPPAWGVDLPALAYLSNTGKEDGGNLLLELRTIQPDNTRAVLGELPYRADCETTSNYQVDQLLRQETGGNILLEWLPGDRFLYSTACNGVGLALFEGGQSLPLGENLRHGALSPDRSHLAALDDTGAVVLINLTTLESRLLTTSAPPDQLGWDVTGTQIFYSTLFPSDLLVFDDPAFQERATAILGIFPFESRLNNVRIFQVDILNGLEALLWEGTGFAIGGLRGAPDGKGLLFTLIPSDRGLLTNFINNAADNVLRNSTPATELYWLPSINSLQPEKGAARLIAFTSQPLFGAPTSP